jgi:pimeloyl-ACP methyl ester carboxylesterase
MHVHCQGAGTPTVVFDSGSGNDGTVWGAIVADLSKVTRACAYDRMGLGYSSYGEKRTRTSQQMADELYDLLHAAHLPGPYVLVAHSSGAWNQRLFAASHSSEVAAMVLVEAATAGHYARYMSMLPPPALEMIENRMRIIPDGWDFASMLKSLDQVAAAPPLGDTPLIVLSRGQAGPPELPGVTPELATQMFAVWTELQAELPKLSTNSAHVTASRSGHMMIWDAYALVVESIQEAVRVTREGGKVDVARLAALASP